LTNVPKSLTYDIQILFMHSKIALIFVFVIALGLVGSASAHKSEVVGDYKIEIGWKNEPPIVGMDNQIELTVTTATAFDKAEAEKEDQNMEGMNMEDSNDSHMDNTDHMMEDTPDSNMTDSDHMMEAGHDDHEMNSGNHMGETISTGILKGFTAEIVLGDNNVPLNLMEDSKYPGVYHAQFTPMMTGFPMVHISGILNDEDVNVTFHPEQVEPLSMLSPLKQMANGISPGDVQCKEGFGVYKRTFDDSAVCLHPSSGEKLILRGVVVHF